MTRPLTTSEMYLVRWMLEHGRPEAMSFLPQLEKAQVTSWHCRCGCASFNLSIEGFPEPSGGMLPIADFLFGSGEKLSGIFIYVQNGVLAGVEVYGYAGDAPKVLPSTEELRPFTQPTNAGNDKP